MNSRASSKTASFVSDTLFSGSEFLQSTFWSAQSGASNPPILGGRAVDPLLLITVASLLTIGWLMVGSASMDYAARNMANPFHFVVRHGVYLCLGFAAMVVTVMVPMKMWQRHSGLLLLVGFLLLVMVLVPGLGRRINGSQRWLSLGGFTLQASELVKVFLLFYLADYFVRWEGLGKGLRGKGKDISRSFMHYLKPMMVIVGISILLLMEPDFGTTVVIVGASLAVVFVAGVPLLRFLMMLSVVVVAAILAVVFEPYRLQRLTSFVDPWADDVKFGSAYQLTQSLIALGRGEWWGVGLGNSVQKLFYLPEAHTDFVFSIWAEEMGFVGVMVVVLLFFILLSRGIFIAVTALRQQEAFIAYVVLGIVVILAMQVVVNMGVVSGLLPTKGLTLPFLSYGGSSLLVCCWMAGLLMRSHWEISALSSSQVGSQAGFKGGKA